MSDLAIAQQRIAEEQELKTGSLDLRDLDLDELPAGLAQLRHLEVLKLGVSEEGLLGRRSQFSKIGDLGQITELRQLRDKYLRSPYCMFELFHLFRHCGDDPDRFLGKVIPLVLADARIGSVRERLAYVRYWKTEKVALQADITDLGADYVDEETYAQFKLIQEFAEKVGKMLTFLNDKLMPRDFDRMAKEGFQELVGLLQTEPEDA